MTKREKRLQKLRQNPRNVLFDELRQILEDHGFILARVTGSHHIFVAEIGGHVWKLTIPFHKPIKTTYVRTALNAIDEINAVQTLNAADEDESDGSDDD